MAPERSAAAERPAEANPPGPCHRLTVEREETEESLIGHQHYIAYFYQNPLMMMQEMSSSAFTMYLKES